VLAVITHENAPALVEGPMTPLGPTPAFALKDYRILRYGQHVAIVVAETPEQAAATARLVKIDYEETTPVLGIDNPQAPVLRNPWGLEMQRGDAAAALASTEVVYDETFTIAAETNNPLGLFATVARWEGDRLTVHDSTQWPTMVSHCLATMLGVPDNDVRVLVPYMGGGFGAGGRTWSHTILAAIAARVVDRPVKLVLTRPQMFTSVGHRPEPMQQLRLGATLEGRLVAIDHEDTSTRATEDFQIEPITMVTGATYACPNVATRDRQVRLNIPSPGAMRGPGATQGNFAIESALDELSYTLRIDPIELRLRNYAEVQPQSVCRGQARPCESAIASVPNDLAGWSAPQRSERCVRATGWSATGWPEPPTIGTRNLVTPACRSAETAAPMYAAPPPTSEPAPTRSRRNLRPSCSAFASTKCASRSVTATCRPHRNPAGQGWRSR
jgi:xanthine dehydrogenase YagR molybdenum-binding subunit